MPDQQWWRGAVDLYQCLPAQLPRHGWRWRRRPASRIASELDYIAAWAWTRSGFRRFFKSPMADFGYDIADYREVDPLFGTLADFDRLWIRRMRLA